MSKKKKQKYFKEVYAKREQAKQVKVKSTEDTGVEVDTASAPAPKKVAHDPAKHKGYVLLYKKNAPNSTMWVPPAEVKGFRAAGWKTDAEVRKIYAKWLKKHPEEAAKMKEQMTDGLNKVKCPLCQGSGRLWVKCCDEPGCGCMHLPVDNDCHICGGKGTMNPQLAESVITDELVAARNEQIEIDQFMQANHPIEV